MQMSALSECFFSLILTQKTNFLDGNEMQIAMFSGVFQHIVAG